MAAHISTVPSSRLRAMVVPREHGAWGMMLVPLATGAVIAAHTAVNSAALIILLIAAVSLFWLRTPLESWLGTSPIKAQTDYERGLLTKALVAIGVIAAGNVVALLWNGHNRGLLLIGAIAALAFAIQAGVKRLGRKGRMPAQIIGAIGLTSTAACAYYVATGRIDRTAMALWLANWLFAADQIHFVQVRIHSSRAMTFKDKLQPGLGFLVGQIGLIAAILAACRLGFFPTAIALAFLPILLRGTLWFIRSRQPLDVHKLGFSELSQALVFGALLCAVFLL